MATDSYERAALIDIATAAVRVGMSIGTLRRKIKAGEVPAYRMGGKGTAIRLDPIELDEWLRRPEDSSPGGRAA